MDKKARDYLSGKNGIMNIMATSIVVSSAYSNFLTKLFIQLVPTPIPTKIFSTEDKAIKWLETQ